MISNKQMATSAEQAVNDVLADVHLKYKGKSDYIKWVVNFTAQRVLARVLTDEQRSNLKITIHVRKHNFFSNKVMAKDNLCGTMLQLEENLYYVQISRDMHITKIISTLIHELCHVAQYVTGAMCTPRNVENKTTIWMGKEYSNDMEYLEMPWEIDARRLESVLRDLADDVLGFNGRDLFHSTRGKSLSEIEARIVEYNDWSDVEID